MEFAKNLHIVKTNERTFKNPFTAFFQWATDQEFYRLGYLVAMLLFQTCILVPFGLWALTVNGGGSIQLGILVVSSFIVVASNLAALSTKYTIPIFCGVNTLLVIQMIYNAIMLLG